MLAFLTILQRGHESRKGSQTWHEERCLHGKKTTHDIPELQLLQTISLLLFCPLLLLPPSSCPRPPSSTTTTLSPFSQHDSASSAPFHGCRHALSFSCSIVLVRDMTMASFSFATLCHACFSISILLNMSSSSIVLFIALDISSSFCFSKNCFFDSYFLSINASCCFLCSCKPNLNLSFCLRINRWTQYQSWTLPGNIITEKRNQESGLCRTCKQINRSISRICFSSSAARFWEKPTDCWGFFVATKLWWFLCCGGIWWNCGMIRCCCGGRGGGGLKQKWSKPTTPPSTAGAAAGASLSIKSGGMARG